MGAHILVVDDDPLLASALRRPLAYEGFEVDVAASGEEALSRALDHAPDLVILDVLLPGIDGLEVCRRLRQAGDVPVLMLTARSEVPERVAGFEAGADDYLGKPFAFEELLVRIKALLRRGRNGSSTAELRFGDLRMDRSTHEVWRGDRSISLTRQESDLLSLMLALTAFGFGVYTYVDRRLHDEFAYSVQSQGQALGRLLDSYDFAHDIHQNGQLGRKTPDQRPGTWMQIAMGEGKDRKSWAIDAKTPNTDENADVRLPRVVYNKVTRVQANLNDLGIPLAVYSEPFEAYQTAPPSEKGRR